MRFYKPSVCFHKFQTFLYFYKCFEVIRQDNSAFKNNKGKVHWWQSGYLFLPFSPRQRAILKWEQEVMQKGPPGSGQVLLLGEVTLCSLWSFPGSLLCEVCFGFFPQASLVPCSLPHHVFIFTFHSETRPLCLPSFDAVAFLHTPSFIDPRRAGITCLCWPPSRHTPCSKGLCQ